MELSQIETIVIACLPALTSILSIVIAVAKVIKSLNALKDNEALKKERDDVVAQNKVLLTELRKQKKFMALYIEKACKIKYEDLTEVTNDEELKI